MCLLSFNSSESICIFIISCCHLTPDANIQISILQFNFQILCVIAATKVLGCLSKHKKTNQVCGLGENYKQAFRQYPKSGRPNCTIGPAQMNNL